jgi:hypothetical protein
MNTPPNDERNAIYKATVSNTTMLRSSDFYQTNLMEREFGLSDKCFPKRKNLL